MVSIVTATLNNAGVLPRALDSVRRQSYSPVEHVIIDGESTDGTREILDTYHRQRPQGVIVIRERDGGMYEAINKGLRRAGGNIIGILNSDDSYCPDAVQRVVECFAASRAEVVLGNARCVGRDNASTESSWQWRPQLSALDSHMSVPHPGMFVRADVYRRIGLFDESYQIGADYEFVLRLRAAGVSMVHLDQIVCEFRGGGMSHTRRWRAAAEGFRIQRKYVGLLPATAIYVRRAVEYSVLRWYFNWRKRGALGAENRNSKAGGAS